MKWIRCKYGIGTLTHTRSLTLFISHVSLAVFFSSHFLVLFKFCVFHSLFFSFLLSHRVLTHCVCMFERLLACLCHNIYIKSRRRGKVNENERKTVCVSACVRVGVVKKESNEERERAQENERKKAISKRKMNRKLEWMRTVRVRIRAASRKLCYARNKPNE